MDGLSIATTILTIAGSSIAVAKAVKTYVDSCRDVDSDVTTIGVELEEFSKILLIFHKIVNSEGFDFQADPRKQLWETVEMSLRDCKVTLKNLKAIMDEINDVEFGGKLKGPIKRWKYDSKSAEINRL